MQDLLGKMATQRHLVALRDGMIAVVPIILVGSTFLLLGSQQEVITKFFPSLLNTPFGIWYTNNFGTILLPYRLTMGMLSVYVAFTIAASLAAAYKMPVLPQGLGGVVAFLITTKPVNIPLEAGGDKVWLIPIKQLGGDGLFLAILCGILTVELSRGVIFLWNRYFQAKTVEASKNNGASEGSGEASEQKPADVGIPKAVADAFASFLPLLCVVTLLWLVRYTVGIDIYGGLVYLMKPMERMGDSLPCVIVINFCLHILGVAGIHGISVINGVFFALWQKFLLANTEAHAAGHQLQYITAYPFYQWFVWIGGAGTTLPIPFMLLFFKNPHMRRIGKVGLVPSLFNVNEPVIFGLPVVANPLLAIPFILVPIVAGTVAFLFVSFGFMTKPFIEVPWVLPPFLGAPLCNQDGRALILLAINLAISCVIWFPFLKAYEKKLEGK
jgi:PTS system cellobiose-specific IIC component